MGKSSSSDSSDTEVEKKILRQGGINLSIQLTEEETEFRKKSYPDVSVVKNENLKCTVCSRNIVTALFVKGRLFRHIVLDVLVCEECLQFYGDGDFSTDEDGTDKYCRWCGQGGRLYCCSKCTCVFCKKCAKQNLKRSEVDKLEHEDWKCFVCRPKPLYPLRAECWAVKEHLQNEMRKKTKRTNKRETSKRKHSSSSEETPSKTKKKDQDPPSKKSRLRAKQISDGSSNDGSSKKRRNHDAKEDSSSSDSSDESKVTTIKSAKNSSKASKRDNSSSRSKREVNHKSVDDDVSSKKSTVSVNSHTDNIDNKTSEDIKVKKNDTKMSKDVKAKKNNRLVESVDSSDGSKSKRSRKSSHSRDSSTSSESKKTKRQIKLACDFLLSTIQNVQGLGNVLLSRATIYEKVIMSNALKTQDDVLKTIHKLSKMLVIVNKNVNGIQKALEENLKNWSAVMDLTNTANLSSLIFNKLDFKNEYEKMETDEIDEDKAAAASKEFTDANNIVTTNESGKPEFPNSADFELSIDDAIETVTKSIEGEAETNAKQETLNENRVSDENADEIRKADITSETEKDEEKSIEERENNIDSNETTVDKNEVNEESISKDTVNTTDDKGNDSVATLSSTDAPCNETKDTGSVVTHDDSINSNICNESTLTFEEETEEIVNKEDKKEAVSVPDKENEMCKETIEEDHTDENSTSKESKEIGSDGGSLDPHMSEPEEISNKDQVGEGGENGKVDDKESNVSDKEENSVLENDKEENSVLENDKAVLAELLNDSSDDDDNEKDDKEHVSSSTSSEDLLLSPSSDEDTKRRRRRPKESKQKTEKKNELKTSKDEEENGDDEERDENEDDEKLDENEEGNKSENENMDDTKQDTDDEIARLTDLSKLSQKKKKADTSSEEDDKSRADSDDTSERSAVVKKEKKESKKSKKEEKEGLLDFLGNSDNDEAEDNDVCEGLSE